MDCPALSVEFAEIQINMTKKAAIILIQHLQDSVAGAIKRHIVA